MWTVFVQPRRRGVFGGTMLEVPKELSKSIRGMTREVQKKNVFVIETSKNVIVSPRMQFLTIKKRLRQAASRGKLCFSQRNAIFNQNKRLRQAAGRGTWCFFREKYYI